jgi:CheY-like chemotaxis protein
MTEIGRSISTKLASSGEYDMIRRLGNTDDSVLINGLTNAMKFCQSGSIVVRLRSHLDNLVVLITDTGVGFDESEMPLVLQPFKKLDINSPGAGLGLYITKAMLEKAGGSLVLRSEKGKGTTFEAMLPVSWAVPEADSSIARHELLRRQIRPNETKNVTQSAIPHTEPSAAVKDTIESSPNPTTSQTASPDSSTKTKGRFESLRVLIVDDNHICLALLSKSLRKASTPIELREASGGLQAVDLFRQFNPELVFTDVSMPGLDGISAAEQMRRHETQESLPRSAIYAVTALGETDARSKSKGMNGSADLDGWLVKGQDLARVARDIADRLSASGNRTSNSTSSSMTSSQTA